MTALGYVHDGHRVQMTTTLAGATILVDGFEGEEAISSLFEFRVRLLAENDALDMNAIVGQAVACTREIIDNCGHRGALQAATATPA